MQVFARRLPRRTIAAVALAALTAGAAGAATLHNFSVSAGNGTGSGGATTYVQTGNGSALQGEVGPVPNTGISLPFGVLGEYDKSGGGFGAGVVGVSTTGYGVAAESLGANPTMLAYAGGTGDAFEATTPSSSSAAAVYAFAKGSGDSVDGVTITNGSTKDAFSNGIAGIDNASQTGYNNGVFGFSATGAYGVQAQGGSGTFAALGAIGTGTLGIDAESDTQSAIFADQENEGSVASYVYEENGVHATAGNGAGVYSYSAQDPAIVGEMGCDVYIADATETGQNCSGLFIQEDGTHGFPIEVYEPSNSSCTYPLYADSEGDLTICGTLTSSTVAKARAPGSDRLTYAAQQTAPTIEDFGSAQLVNGQARVPLSADFKASIDGSRSYMVFLTPYGENHGLYVASRTPDGFVIRESDGVRSSMAVDYRIVAQPRGTQLERLPHAAPLADINAHAPHRNVSHASLVRAAHERSLAPYAKKNGIAPGPMGAAMRARLLRPRLVANPFAAHQTR